MDNIIKFLLLFLLNFATQVNSETYSVKIGTEKFVNVVDKRFLSFTVDPRYLFGNSEKYNSQESICMASSLTPAYIRIAGPSTAHLSISNSTITYTDLTTHKGEKNEIKPIKKMKKLSFENIVKHLGFGDDNISVEESEEESGAELKRTKKHLEVSKELTKDDLENRTNENPISNLENNSETNENPISKENENSKTIENLILKGKEHKLHISNDQWRQFVDWTKRTGFDLVFALNNEDKNEVGQWDANKTIDVLSMAAKANVSDIYWQLGYECSNQSVDDYLNDLETLRVMTETFNSKWRTVGGDVTKCLQSDSKSDFIDYVTLSEDMMDAIFLNGNSSSQELEKLSESDRVKLLKLLSQSKTPLWLTENELISSHDQLFRAADWMISLGYSARNGFAAYFRELVEEELFEPTLSFYMALLYKNLVGERVLNADMEASQAVLFAHCTSLSHKPVPGAVTLYAANMDSAPARFSIKLSRREEGGDIMQFILSQDSDGNILINGKERYHEGDIQPIVKRVRPYRTLLINLPAKSFGFWVIANTKIEACHDYEDDNTKSESVEATTDDINVEGSIKVKRSVLPYPNDEIIKVTDVASFAKEALKRRLRDLNNDFKNVHKTFQNTRRLKRNKRSTSYEDHNEVKERLRYLKRRLAEKFEDSPKFEVFRKLISAKNEGGVRNRVKKTRFYRSKYNKKSPKYDVEKSDEVIEGNMETKSRRRRSVEIDEKKNLKVDDISSAENEIDADLKQAKLWKILHEIHKQIKDIESENENEKGNNSDSPDSEEKFTKDRIIVKKKVVDNPKMMRYSETKNGLLKSTIDNVVSVLGELNNNLNRFWSAFSFLE